MTYWTKVRHENVWRYELAGDTLPEQWTPWVNKHLGIADLLEFKDARRGNYRCAYVVADQLQCCFFVSERMQLPQRAPLLQSFNKTLYFNERLSLLAGELGRETARGDIICSCYGVGKNTIVNAIQTQGLNSVKEIGAALKAGTNCGSCIPELKQLLKSQAG